MTLAVTLHDRVIQRLRDNFRASLRRQSCRRLQTAKSE
jgi:hypothetical protein